MSHENQRLEDGFPIEIIHWNYDQDAIVTTRIIPFVLLGNPEKNLYLPRLHPGGVNRQRSLRPGELSRAFFSPSAYNAVWWDGVKT